MLKVNKLIGGFQFKPVVGKILRTHASANVPHYGLKKIIVL